MNLNWLLIRKRKQLYEKNAFSKIPFFRLNKIYKMTAFKFTTDYH